MFGLRRHARLLLLKGARAFGLDVFLAGYVWLTFS